MFTIGMTLKEKIDTEKIEQQSIIDEASTQEASQNNETPKKPVKRTRRTSAKKSS